MGGGASKKQAGKPATGPGAFDPSLSLSLRRRRRLLLGQDGPRNFEHVPPQQQYSSTPDEDEDPVFRRLKDNVDRQTALRTQAFNLQDKDGLLDENAIELLDMKLGTGSPLSKRLFAVGQVQSIAKAAVQQIPPGAGAGLTPPQLPGGRRGKLTCYELLALYSLLKEGSDEDLIQLLFCVFDVDGDDRLSHQDLATMIVPFLQLTGAAEGLEGVDQTDYTKLIGKPRQAAMKQLVDKAIEKHGQSRQTEEEMVKEVFRILDPEPGKGFVSKAHLIEMCHRDQFIASVLGMPDKTKTKEVKEFFAKLEAVEDSGMGISMPELKAFRAAREEESLAAIVATASGAALAPGAEAPKPETTAQSAPLLEGQTRSSSAHSESEQSVGGASTDAAVGKEPEKQAAKKQKKGGMFSCGGKKMPDDESEDEHKGKASPKAQAAPKQAAKKKGNKNEPKTLGLDEFKAWLVEANLLPPSYAAVVTPPKVEAPVAIGGYPGAPASAPQPPASDFSDSGS